MDQARTSPKNMILAFLAAAVLAMVSLLMAAGASGASSDNAGSGWRKGDKVSVVAGSGWREKPRGSGWR